ncbi:hypothetical protein [Hyphomicrobium sp. ghe19]|uniref:hypothetical protein n=1 Tax=Hyphomicrobium sp. ghe19 TaxID=2682968 RepID=UPI001366F678|nr:hypothetical protein HYPP_03831 [Hyphomicrobium sp. ghe19]
MSGVRRDTSGDAFADFLASRTEPEIKLSSAEATRIREVLEEADSVLKQVEGLKQMTLVKRARNVRTQLVLAYAALLRSKSEQ